MDTTICSKFISVEEAINRRELERRWAQRAEDEEICFALYVKQIDTETKEPFIAAKSIPGSETR